MTTPQLNTLYLKPLKNLIHSVKFPLCGTPFGEFHRAGSFHPINKGRLFFTSLRGVGPMGRRPRLSGWSFQRPSASHFRKAHPR